MTRLVDPFSFTSNFVYCAPFPLPDNKSFDENYITPPSRHRLSETQLRNRRIIPLLAFYPPTFIGAGLCAYSGRRVFLHSVFVDRNRKATPFITKTPKP